MRRVHSPRCSLPGPTGSRGDNDKTEGPRLVIGSRRAPGEDRGGAFSPVEAGRDCTNSHGPRSTTGGLALVTSPSALYMARLPGSFRETEPCIVFLERSKNSSSTHC